MQPYAAQWLSIVPPIVAIGLALYTKEVFSSLFIGKRRYVAAWLIQKHIVKLFVYYWLISISDDIFSFVNINGRRFNDLAINLN